MASPDPQDWQQRLRDLEMNIGSNAKNSEPLNEIDVDAVGSTLDAAKQSYQQFITWFDGIPASGKLLAIAAGGLLSLTAIKTVFQLVTSLITLSILVTILYLVYRFWVSPKSNE
jgi:type IV secretory pathway VirB6-like protein